MRVLLADDNADNLLLVRQVLTFEGYEVVLAHDGLEALQQEARTLPDLVILDVNMPRFDGWEVCARIKARRDVPVILLTVRAERAAVERSYAAGADAHLSKPFDIAEFLACINSFAAVA
jgi:CheY-like chemotaxis protein